MTCQGLRPFQVGDFRCYVRTAKAAIPGQIGGTAFLLLAIAGYGL